jgi:DNA-binding transcriptional regulator YhcF (GntR family)
MSGEEPDEAELFIYRQLKMKTYQKAFESLQMEGPVHPKRRLPIFIKSGIQETN